MFALVRFADDLDRRLHVVPVSNIEDFDVTDYENKKKKGPYTVFWEDTEAGGEDTGFYDGYVLLIAETQEELERKKSLKRIQIPKMAADEVAEVVPDDSTAQKKEKQAALKMKKVKAQAKSAAYDKMLNQHLKDAREKRKGGTKRAPTTKRARPETSSSESEDSLCAKSELRSALAEKKIWKDKALKLEDDKQFLLGQVSSLQRCLESKIFQLEGRSKLSDHDEEGEAHALWEHNEDDVAPACARNEQYTLPWEGVTPSCSSQKQGAVPAATSIQASQQPLQRSLPAASAVRASQQPLQRSLPAASAMRVSHQPLQSSAMHASQQPLQRSLPAASAVRANQQLPQLPEEFVHLADGSFHLAKGVFVTSGQATKILNNKKPTLVAKDTAQAIWTNEVLADRSVHGGVAPNKRALGERAKKQLSPEKVQVVAATVRYWGSKKSIDVDSTVAALSRLLSEKIQDARKSLKKQGTKTHDSEGLNAQGQNTQDQDARVKTPRAMTARAWREQCLDK